MNIDGRCLCGLISFEAEIDANQVFVCHCTDCQTQSGGTFRTVVRARPDTCLADVEIILGDGQLAIINEQEQGGSQEFDFLILDAFSSDAMLVTSARPRPSGSTRTRWLKTVCWPRTFRTGISNYCRWLRAWDSKPGSSPSSSAQPPLPNSIARHLIGFYRGGIRSAYNIWRNL